MSLRPSKRIVALTALVCGLLVAGSVPPVSASERSDPGASPVVGAFGLGDDLEATISERDGALEFNLQAAGLALKWDSRAAAGADRHGLGPAWGLGMGGLSTLGGVKVERASGGSYPADPTHPTGLAGYGVLDTRFDQVSGALADRADGVAPAGSGDGGAEYEYVLHELGGTTAYFNALGDPIAHITATEERSDWYWDPLVPHRLTGVVDEHGVRTDLDWDSEPGAVLVRQGANLPPEQFEDGREPIIPTWRIELDGGQVARVVDPAGGHVQIDYTDDGLVSRLAGRSGATTEVAWRAFDDGAARVETVRTMDGDGRELSIRRWAAIGDGTPSSGWPTYAGDDDVFRSGDPSFRYSTELSDGATRVRSEYNSLHELIGRHLVVTTPSGEVTLREQAFVYPGTDDGGVPDPAALPGNWPRPVRSETTFRDPHGGTRTAVESFEFDELGRMTGHTAIDGSHTATEYDDVVPADRPLPIGLETSSTVTAPDGLVSRIVHRLNDERTAVVEAESWRGERGAPLTSVARAEYEVDPDGFVREQRVHPMGEEGAPVRTTRSRTLDLAAGTMTSSETVGAGTQAEATSRAVNSLRHGGELELTGPAGTTVSSSFDELGRVVEEVDALGKVRRTDYETAQRDGRNATTIATPDGVERTEIRDALGRVIRSTDNVDHGVARDGHVRVVEIREYPAPGVVSITDAWGATTTATQDVLGRETSVATPTGLVKVTEYDDVANRMTTGHTPTGSLADAEQIATQTLDPGGRPIAAEGRRKDGRTVPTLEHTLDGFGRPVSTTDGIVTTTTAYDVAGNPARTTLSPARNTQGGEHDLLGDGLTGDGRPIIADHRFDGFGAETGKSLGDGTHSREGVGRTFDALGRATEETDQLGRVTAISHTVDGMISRVEYGNGQLMELTYDPESRLLIRASRSGLGMAAVTSEHRYDHTTARLIEKFDPSDPDGSRLTFEYDALGNTTRLGYPDGASVEHEYDTHGRRTATVDAAGARTEYSYDHVGLVVAAVQTGADDEVLASVEYTYDAYGRVIALARGNGVVTEFTYTSASEVATERTTRNGDQRSAREYTYDGRGNLTERVDSRSDEPEGAELGVRTTYEYDAFDRLLRSTVYDGDGVDAAVASVAEYELSPHGDVIGEIRTTRPGGSSERGTSRAFEYSPLGELIETTATDLTPGGETETRSAQAFDDAGNLIRGADGTTYEYNAANRLTAQTDPDGTVRHTKYWADGARRSLSTLNDETGVAEMTTFYWDGATLLNDVRAGGEETDAASSLIGVGREARTNLGARSVDEAEAFTTSYLGADRHGNITELTDHSGALTAAYAYTDYGVRSVLFSSSSEVERNPFGYAGGYTDPDGTQPLGARIYDADTMRFTTMDTADMHNTFAFADLNPIMNVDPSGRAAEADGSKLGLVVGMAVVGLILTLASMAVVPPVGIMKLITVAALLGDVVGVIGGTAKHVSDAARSEDVQQAFDTADIALTTMAAAGMLYGIGRFIWSGMTALAAQAARKATARGAASSLRNLPDGEFHKLETKALEFIADAQLTQPQFVAKHTPNHAFSFSFDMKRFIWKSPVELITQKTNVVHPVFWWKFWRNASSQLGGGRTLNFDILDGLIRLLYTAEAEAAQVARLRQLGTQVSSLDVFSNHTTTNKYAYGKVAELGGEIARADQKRPLTILTVEDTIAFAKQQIRAGEPAKPWWKTVMIGAGAGGFLGGGIIAGGTVPR